MSTYQQSSLPGPLEPQRPGRRRPTDDNRIPPGPADQFRRRLGLIAVIGLLLAPVVWAMRGDGEKISGTQSGGAAAIVQMDPSTDASEATDLTNSPTTSLSVIITAAATLAPTTRPVCRPASSPAPTTPRSRLHSARVRRSVCPPAPPCPPIDRRRCRATRTRHHVVSSTPCNTATRGTASHHALA
jgi:hypothetical protein